MSPAVNVYTERQKEKYPSPYYRHAFLNVKQLYPEPIVQIIERVIDEMFYINVVGCKIIELKCT